jgi:hypothetical protein
MTNYTFFGVAEHLAHILHQLGSVEHFPRLHAEFLSHLVGHGFPIEEVLEVLGTELMIFCTELLLLYLLHIFFVFLDEIQRIDMFQLGYLNDRLGLVRFGDQLVSIAKLCLPVQFVECVRGVVVVGAGVLLHNNANIGVIMQAVSHSFFHILEHNLLNIQIE